MTRSHLIGLVAIAPLVIAPMAQAFAQEEGNWKRGRIYYRTTCTACHVDQAGGSIAPAAKTIAEWEAWIQSEDGGAHLDEYVSQEYRNSIAGENRVAAKFAPIPDEEMRADVSAFVIHGAKDSATPATCN